MEYYLPIVQAYAYCNCQEKFCIHVPFDMYWRKLSNHIYTESKIEEHHVFVTYIGWSPQRVRPSKTETKSGVSPVFFPWVSGFCYGTPSWNFLFLSCTPTINGHL